MTKRLTRKAFEKWLSEQPARRLFRTCSPNCCPVASFTNRTIQPFRHRGWARSFLYAVDGTTHGVEGDITAARALKILRSIP